ncbi:MAG: hypothetical protein KDA78_17790, partial [Planctomycetaceae bacterium]|nr:hypothetical protein [Planctomycetaceae bacterium]
MIKFPFLTLLVWNLFFLGTLCQAEEQAAEETKAEEKAYELAYRFESGNFVKYHVLDQSQFTTRKNEVAETVRNESQQWRHYRVIDVNDEGVATLELMIDRARLTAQFDNSPPTVFDSQDPSQQPAKMSSIMNSIGRPLCRMQVNRQ